jgi:hypothetical protein
MTNQTAFNRVVRNLFVTLGEHPCHGYYKTLDSYATDYGPVYRNVTDKTCAVGCLIPKKLYDKVIEGTAVDALFDGTEQTTSFNTENKYNKVRRKIIDHWKGLNRELLSELQNIHDNCEPDEWKKQLIRVAKRYYLTLPKELRK